MIVSGILFLSMCLLFDHMIFENLIHQVKNHFRTNGTSTSTTMDSDVADETENIKRMTEFELKESNLALHGLSKIYGKNLAVNQLYLGVNTSECFGLLV